MDTSNAPTMSKSFHTESRANGSHDKENSPVKFDIKDGLKFGKVHSNTLTIPRSPNLRTKHRSKPTTLLPTEEYKIREMQNYKFKANPVDKKIFENRNLGVPKVKKLKLTEPYSPPITKPKPLRPKSPSPPHIIKSNPVPDYREPYRPVIEHRLIELPTFSLPGEEISKMKSREIEERIRREKEEMEKLREFKAQPLPTGSPDCLPIRPYYPSTHPKPFALLTDDRGEKYQREFYERVEKVRKDHEMEIQFHARPLPDFEPKIPRKPECPPLTEPVGFNFLTDTRMKERHIYDELRRLREKEVEEQKIEKFREEEARNAEEIRQLRADLVHHAQPIRYYQPIIIKPSNKKPTKPISPMIGEKRRKYMQMLNNYEYLDDVRNTSNVESLDQILHSSFEDQVLTPIDECIMTGSVSEQMQTEGHDEWLLVRKLV